MYSVLIIKGYRAPDIKSRVIFSDFARAGGVAIGAPTSSIGIDWGLDEAGISTASVFWVDMI